MARAERERSRKHPQPPPIKPTERRRRGRPCEPLIPVSADGLGPAMLALSPAMRAFVIAKVEFGQPNHEAARMAGYSAASPHALSVVASRLAHDERVQSALLEEGQKLMRSEGPKSVHTLVEVRDDKRNAAKDRIKAATELLDRSGFHALSEHHLTVEHHLSDEQKDARIMALAAEMGLSQDEARKLLIAPGKEQASIVDAEFEVVQPPDPQRERENDLQRKRRARSPEERAAHKEQLRQQRSERAKQRLAEVAGREGLEDVLGPISEGEANVA
jgi:hypothetical protein